jgi:ATP-binding cassette, subfamily B, multidrug efflux pump
VSAHPEAHPEEATSRAYDAGLMRRLLSYVRPYRAQAVSAVVLIVLSSLLQLVGPLVTGVALDLYLQPPAGADEARRGSWAGDIARLGLPDEAARGILALAAIYLAALLLAFVVLYAQSLVMQRMGQRIMADLRAEVFAHAQRLPVAFFDRTPVGRLLTRVTTDVDSLNELFTAGLVSVFGDVVLLGGIVTVLFWMNWRLALVTFAVLPLLAALTAWFKARARTSFREVRVQVALLASFLQEHITGMSVVQLFGREARTAADFAAINEEHRAANVRGIFYYAVFYPGVDILTALGVAAIVGGGGVQVLGGTLTVGALVAFLQYAQRFYQPLSDLAEKYNIVQQAMASSERIFDLLDQPLSAAAATGDPVRVPPRVVGAVEFADVSFSYKAGQPVLRGVSFRVAPGETVAVVGHTGAGKSTLANLLLRFYDIDSGAVLVDGIDVREWDATLLRRSIGLVLQDVFLFSGTIAHNLRLGALDITDERLRWAAAEAQALDFIEKLPGGFEAAVRERGAGLSVGQKQLLAFARALAHDPKLLVLDEATSAIDTETEQLIQKALSRLLAGRTAIVIAHRLSTVQRADRILVLHRGELREQGTHDELLAARGLYHRLFALQFPQLEGRTAAASPE